MGSDPGRALRVAIVLADEHASEIEGLLLQGPVWVLRTARTEALAERLWESTPSVELTLLNAGADPPGAIALFAQIEEHHGEASGYPPVAQIEVWGQLLSEQLGKELSAIGFGQIAAFPHGFIASRT